jgi:protein-L-isoaspartate(D-aspartate) O-methyltransferase
MTAPIDFERARFNMIEQQIRPWNVLDDDVLTLLQEVRREAFVPPAYRDLAFADMEIPLLGEPEEALRKGHCMLPPAVEARMLQDVAPRGHEKILEVGAGSGYMAALLASRAQRVITLDLEPRLVQMARENLQRCGVHNVEVREADGAKGLAAEGPFDAIVLSGSVHQVPQVLLAQLKVGGRLVAIVGDEPMMRASVYTRTGEGSWESRQPWDIIAPRLLHFPEPSRFHF